VLCAMASVESSAECFLSTQGWTSLVTRFSKWSIESSLMYVLLLSLLAKGVTRSLVSSDMIQQACMWVCKLSSCLDGSLDQPHVHVSAFTHHPSGKGASLFDPHLLLQLAARSVNQATGGLPAMVLLVLLRIAWQQPIHKSCLISSGGLLVLQTLLTQMASVTYTCTPSLSHSSLSSALDSDTVQAITAEGQALLLDALACSEFARHHLLTSWVTLATDTSLMTEAQGRDPLAVKTDHTHTHTRERSESDGAGAGAGAGANNVQKDIELRPKDHGTAWRLSSTLLHARCPGVLILVVYIHCLLLSILFVKVCEA
jgi:hypothetical protein